MVEEMLVYFHNFPQLWRGMREGFTFIGLAVVLMLVFGRPVARA